MAKPGDPDFEDRRLHYLNGEARTMTPKQRAAFNAKFADIIEAMTEKPAPKKKAAPSPKGEAQSIEEIVEGFGPLAVALVALAALNDDELSQLGAAAEALMHERNPDAPDAPDADDVAESFVADEAGAYAQPDGAIIKFASGDKLHMAKSGLMRVESPIPDDFATLQFPAAMALAKRLGAGDDVKKKADALAFIELAAGARAEEIAAIPDPE